MPYLDNATSPGADGPLILTRTDIFLLQIEILKTSDYSIALKISHFKLKRAKMAENGGKCHIWTKPHRQIPFLRNTTSSEVDYNSSYCTSRHTFLFLIHLLSNLAFGFHLFITIN